jgi:hypothetical protein
MKWTVNRPRPKKLVDCKKAKTQKVSGLQKGQNPKSQWTVKRPKPKKSVDCKKAKTQKVSGL